jgi:hypothetical protein
MSLEILEQERAAIISRLSGLASEGKSLLQSLPTPGQLRQAEIQAVREAQGTGFIDGLVEEGSSTIGQELAAGLADFLGVRKTTYKKIGTKAGRKYGQNLRRQRDETLRKQVQETYQRQLSNCERQALQWGEQVLQCLSGFSTSDKRLTQRGNSHHQIAAFHREIAAARLQTRISHGIDFLESLSARPEIIIPNSQVERYLHEEHLSRTILVKKGETLTGMAKLQEIISCMHGTIRFQDPYPWPETLLAVKMIEQGVQVRFLIGKLSDPHSFTAMLSSVRKSGRDIQVKILIESNGKAPFHDRYIISKDNAWTMGTSPNGIGMRDSSITRLEDWLEIERRFDEWWNDPRAISM